MKQNTIIYKTGTKSIIFPEHAFWFLNAILNSFQNIKMVFTYHIS